MASCGLIAVASVDSQDSNSIQPVENLRIKVRVLVIKGIYTKLSITIVMDDELSAHGAGTCQQAEYCQN